MQIISKKIIGAFLIFALAFMIASHIKAPTTEAVDVTADFTDANFLACVSNALGTPGSVDDVDAATLSNLNCNNSNISNIAGAEHLTSLMSFYVNSNNISDLSPLSGLTPLKNLGLDDNNVSSISPLSGLIALEQIWLSNSSISDLSPLSGMSNLYRLVLYSNNISDLSPISGLTNMQHLYINDNNISDLSPLTNFTLLETLHCSRNNISDFSVLSDKTNLQYLHLISNDISDISFLISLTNLRELWLRGNNIVDPSALSAMTSLTDLDLDDNYISDITSLASGNADLANFASGNTINLSNNPLCDPDDFTEIALLVTNGATITNDPLICGNGIAATKCNEQCDDGNLVSGDGCSATCQGEYYGCYMTFVTPPISISHFSCNNGCKSFGYAGGWSPNSQSCMCYISNSAVCDAICTAVDGTYPTSGLTCGFINCGNGILEPDGVWPAREKCDDGNLVSGDGCSSICIKEIIGGSRKTYVPPCTPLPVKIDITNTSVEHEDKKISVILNWEKIPEGGTIKIKRNNSIVHTIIDTNVLTWTDENIPKSVSPQQFKYQLINESCDQTAEGNEITVLIEPTIPSGTAVNVKLDLKIKVKDAYDTMIIERLKNLFIESDIEIPAYSMICEDVKGMFLKEPKSELVLEYIITCFCEDDEKLIREIILKQKNIVPPLIAMLKDLNGKATEQTIQNYISSKIMQLRDTIDFRELTLLKAKEDGLNAGSIIYDADKISITDLNQDDIETMMLINENYFDGASHYAYLNIEKYRIDEETEIFLDSYTTYTDIFGRANNVNIGELISGQDYILKIKLADKRFVLPKIINLQINNASKIDNKYEITVDYTFSRHFRFGDFNEDEVINILDIETWGKLLRGKYENGYELWQLWEFANLDGHDGIDLSDILTIQQNWGSAEE